VRHGALILAALALALAGCGGGSTTSTSAPGAHRSSAGTTPTAAAKPKAPPAHGPRRTAVPILMYHLVNTPPPGTAYPELWVPPASFKSQIQALAGAGYRGVTLDQVLANWRDRIALPAKPIVVSFDDGYGSQVRNAMPVLHGFGWPGVLNLEVKNLSVAGGITKAQVRRLIAAGWEIDAHTINHLDLTTLDAATLRHEVAGSRQILRRDFHVPVDNFAYPAGRYDAAAEAAVRAAGFRAAVTTQLGLAHMGADRAALPRIRVNGSDSAGAVLQEVQSAR
jgi:peptidoglycan/xylan/chitin deacetylase (PgdA/CDA1 family)